MISWSKNFTKNHSNFLWTPPFNHPNFFLFFLHKGAFKYYIRTYWEGYCRPHPTSISDPYWRKTYLNTGPKWRTNQYFGSSPNPKGRGVVSWHCFFVFYSHDCCKGGEGYLPLTINPVCVWKCKWCLVVVQLNSYPVCPLIDDSGAHPNIISRLYTNTYPLHLIGALGGVGVKKIDENCFVFYF